MSVRRGRACRVKRSSIPAHSGVETRQIERVAGVLHDTLILQRVAPGHCTSERGFAAFIRKFGQSIRSGGLGTTLQLPR